MFIWEFIAGDVLNEMLDWFYSQLVGFLGNFFSEMGNLGVELFDLPWVQSILQFFSYLAWALYVTGIVIACFQCGIEYASGRGDIRATMVAILKGFFAVNLFTIVPIRLYELSVTMQASMTAGLTGYGATTIGEAASAALADYSLIESLTDMGSGSVGGMGLTSPFMIIVSLALMSYAVIKVFLSNLKRGGILLIQIAVGSLLMMGIPCGNQEGLTNWCKQVIALCLTAFLQATMLTAGLMVFREHLLLGLGMMLAAGDVPQIAGHFGLETTAQGSVSSAVNVTRTTYSAMNFVKRVVA